MAIGNPVDLTTGRKLLLDSGETDFVLPGLMPIEWSRFYASDLTVDSVLGQGWVLPWEQSLRRSGSFLYLTDNQGRSVPFVDIKPGERIYNAYEQIYLVCTLGGHYLLQTRAVNCTGTAPSSECPSAAQRSSRRLGQSVALAEPPTLGAAAIGYATLALSRRRQQRMPTMQHAKIEQLPLGKILHSGLRGYPLAASTVDRKLEVPATDLHQRVNRPVIDA